MDGIVLQTLHRNMWHTKCRKVAWISLARDEQITKQNLDGSGGGGIGGVGLDCVAVVASVPGSG